MNKIKILDYLVGGLTAVLLLGVGYVVYESKTQGPSVGGDSTMTTLNPFRVSSGYILPNNAANGLKIPSLASANLCLKTDATGIFATTTCGTGGGSGTTTWGSIIGTLSNQTDLQNALDAKLSTTTAASTYYLQSNPASYITASALTPYLTTTTAASTYQPIGSYLTGTKVDSFNTRTGAVTLSSADVTGALTYTPYNATNPSNYISLGSLSGTSPITYNNGTGAIGFNGSGYVSNAYASSTFPSFSYATSTYVARNDWTTIDNYPAACGAGQYVTSIGDTLTCNTPPGSTYTASGTLLNLTGTAFSVNAGTLTNNKACNFVTGTGLVCDSTYLTGNQSITLSGDVSGSGTTAITTSYNNVVPINKGGTATTSAPTQTGQLMSSVGTGWGVSNLVNTTYATWATSTPGSLSVSISGLQPAGSYLTAETDPVVKALNGIIVSNGSTISAITNNSTTWDKALQWDGGSTSLVAATGRTSLGLTDTATLASSTWLKVANNLSDLNNAGTARTNLGLGGLAVLGVPSAGIVTSNGSTLSNITDSSTNWNTAYTDRLKWDGGSTGLTAATGRTSLGLGTMALEANTGSTTITTLGTIGTGTWNATTIGTSKGGTGITSAPTITGQLLMANSTNWAIGNLVAGTNITITTSTPGSITITASGGSGSVTSVDMTVPTGLTVSGNPITTNGTLAVSLQAGYNIPLTASTTNWNGFFDTPSTRITAGTGLSWSTNTLNASNAFTGSGTAGFVTHWDSATALSAGKLIDNGTVLGMNATSSTIGFNIQGTAGTNDIFNIASSSTTSILKVTSASQVLIDPGARLTIPQGSAPTITAAGDIAVDTTGDQFIYHGGGDNIIQATSSKTMTLVNPTASEDDDFGYFDVPITITKVTCSARNQNTSSMTFSLWHGTNRSGSGSAYLTAGQVCNGTTTPISITSFTDNTLAAGEMLVATTSSVTLASTTSITIFYKYDRQ